MPQVCRFAGDGSVSYTDRNKKEFLAGYSSDQDIWRSGRFHLVHVFCLPSSKALLLIACSSSCLTSPRTISLLSLPCALFHSLNSDNPIPSPVGQCMWFQWHLCVEASSLLLIWMNLMTTSYRIGWPLKRLWPSQLHNLSSCGDSDILMS